MSEVRCQGRTFLASDLWHLISGPCVPSQSRQVRLTISPAMAMFATSRWGRHVQHLRKTFDMTSNRRARLGRILLASGFAGLLALAACEKGPDKAETAAAIKSGVEGQLKKLE